MQKAMQVDVLVSRRPREDLYSLVQSYGYRAADAYHGSQHLSKVTRLPEGHLLRSTVHFPGIVNLLEYHD